jgi:type I restriction enzyme M protein
VNRDENVNYEEKMTELQNDLKGLLIEEEKSKNELLNVFKELGYEL